MSEDSEDEVAEGESHEEMNYRRKYQMLLERCEVLQQDNERLLNRIQHIYKFTRQARKERKYLIERLEKHNDNWQQGINQYFLDSLNRSAKSKGSHSEKPSRRHSSTKKSRSRDAEHKRGSKDGKSWIDKFHFENDHHSKMH